MNAGVTSSGSPNQNGRTSGSPMPAFAPSRIGDEASALTAGRPGAAHRAARAVAENAAESGIGGEVRANRGRRYTACSWAAARNGTRTGPDDPATDDAALVHPRRAQPDRDQHLRRAWRRRRLRRARVPRPLGRDRRRRGDCDRDGRRDRRLGRGLRCAARRGPRSMKSDRAAIEAIADALITAYDDARMLPPISASRAGFDVAAAYDVLAEVESRRRAQGWTSAGRKIGFTNVTIWARYGVDRPMWAHVWTRTVRDAPEGRATLSLAGLVQPRIEPEVVFGLAGPVAT